MLPRKDMAMDLHDKADEFYRTRALEILADKLRDGKKVGRCDFTGLLDCELNDSIQYLVLLSEISALLQTNNTDRKYLAEKIRDGIIERYLAHPDQEPWISQEMAEIEAEEPDTHAYLRETEAAA